MTPAEFVVGIWSDASPPSKACLLLVVVGVVVAGNLRKNRPAVVRSAFVGMLLGVPVAWATLEAAIATIDLVTCWFGCCHGLGRPLPYKTMLVQNLTRVAIVALGTLVAQGALGIVSSFRILWMAVLLAGLTLVADAFFLFVLEWMMRAAA